MENTIKNVRFVVLSLALIIVLSVNVEVQMLNEANALQLVSLSTGNQNAVMTVPIVYNSWNAHVVATQQNLLVVNASNNALIANLSVSATINSATKFISGIDCQNTAQVYHSTNVGTGGTEYCVVDATGGSGSDRVFIVDITHGIVPAVTTAGFSYNLNYLYGRCTISGIPQIGGTVYCMYSDTSGANHVFLDYLAINYTIANGVPTTPQIGKGFTRTTHFDTGYTSGVAQPNDMEITTLLSQNTGTTTNEIAWTLHGGTQVALFNLGSIAQICTAGTGTEAFGATFTTDPSGVNKWYVGIDNAIKVITDGSCNVTNTLNLSTYDASAGHIRGIMAGTIRKELYIQDDIGNMVSMNQSTFTKIAQFKISSFDSTGVDGSRRILATNDNPNIGGAGQTDLGIAITGDTKYYIQYWANAGAPPSPPPNGTCNPATLGPGQFCNSQGQTCVNVYDVTGKVLITTYCSTSQSGGKITTPNTISNIATGANLTNMGNVFGCGLGITSCTNTDVTTNGVGLFLLLILIIFSYALVVSIHYKVAEHASQGGVQLVQVLNVNPMLLVVMLIADVGIAFAVGWVNGIPFYTMVVGIVGFLTFGIYKRVSGGNAP